VRFAEDHFSDHVDLTILRVASVFWRSNVLRAKIDEMSLNRGARAAAIESAVASDLPARLTGASQSGIQAMLSEHSAEVVALCASEGTLDEVGRWFAGLNKFAPVLNGSDLVEAGVGEGPEIAIGLEAARVFQIEHGCSDRDELLINALNAIGLSRGEST
jgi:hypothetical protein